MGVHEPALPTADERRLRLQMRTVGRRAPLSMLGWAAVHALFFVLIRIVRLFLPWHVDEWLSPQSWFGVAIVAGAGLATVLAMTWRSQYWLVVHKHGSAVVAKKQWWQRLRDRHVLFGVDASSVRLSDDDPWWKATTTTIEGGRYALLMQRSALARCRSILANPHKPLPPLY